MPAFAIPLTRIRTLAALQGASDIPLLQAMGAGGGGAGKKKRAKKPERDPNKPKYVCEPWPGCS